MAEPNHINITVDEDALRVQIGKTLDDVFVQFSQRLRHAADILDPEFHKYQDQWREEEIERRVKIRLSEERVD